MGGGGRGWLGGSWGGRVGGSWGCYGLRLGLELGVHRLGVFFRGGEYFGGGGRSRVLVAGADRPFFLGFFRRK